MQISILDKSLFPHLTIAATSQDQSRMGNFQQE